MTDAISIESVDLKCDAVGCDHVEKIPAISDEYIGKLCPKCGANMLTQTDYEAAKMMESMASIFNKVIGPIEPSGEATMVSVNPHDGEWKLRIRAND